MDEWIAPLLATLALPQFGLSTVFVVAFLSATLLPMGCLLYTSPSPRD